MYKDMYEKLKFHKEKIIQGFIKLGIYPNNDKIQYILNTIDLSLPFLQIQEANEGDKFNCKAYNQMVENIYRDLKLLYKLLEEIQIKEYIELQAFIDSHLNYLENKTNYYLNKSKQENNTTSLGKTIFFKDDSFNITIKNTLTFIDLGSIDIVPGSRIACLLDANDIYKNQAIFIFEAPIGNLKVTPFNANQNSLLIPGEKTKNEYDYSLNDNLITNDKILMDLKIEINKENKYYILGEKDKVFVKQFGETTKQSFMYRPTPLNQLGFKEKTYIDFYTVGSQSITFKFSKKPVKTNFAINNYKVENLDYVHHFFIEAEPDFSFEFEIDKGDVYAIKEEGKIINDNLYFPKMIETKDFHIIEYDNSKKTKYNCYVQITNDNDEPIKINSITIKQLLTFENGGDNV